MKVTISDVAKLAGVSTATVSHTINNTRYVSNETKEKVYRAIEELGYTPDASARSFRTGKKKIIGFIVPDIANKFFATMIESVEKYLSANGYQLIIANTRENMDREETNIRLLTAGLVDGLLVASTMDDFQRFDALIPAGFPVVLVDRIFETKKYSSVCVSNFQPIYRSVCRLAGKGDQRIGIIGGLPRLSSTQERISAYRQAVADCGLPEDEHLIQYGDSLENSACACLDQLLERKCDAIIVCQGLMASETIIYLHQKGIQLAQDIDLVSFVDYDSDVYALYANQMDSIIQPVEDLGQAAGEQILRRVEVPDAPIFENVLTSTYRPYNQPRAWSHSTAELKKRAASAARFSMSWRRYPWKRRWKRAPGSPAKTIVPSSGKVTVVSPHRTEEAVTWPFPSYTQKPEFSGTCTVMVLPAASPTWYQRA